MTGARPRDAVDQTVDASRALNAALRLALLFWVVLVYAGAVMALLACCLAFVLWACRHVAAETRELADMAEADQNISAWRGTR